MATLFLYECIPFGLTFSLIMHKYNNFSIGYWNVNGLGTKINDNDCLYYVSRFQLCFLSETWLNKSINVPNKVVVCKQATKNKCKRGRYSGGIVALIDKDIRKGIQVVNQNSKYGIWLKIDKMYSKLPQDIFVCGVYLPPEGSPYAIPDIFDKIENDLNKFSTIGKTVVMGDFNGRTANKLDYILPDKTDLDLLSVKYTPQTRFNQDVVSNNRGNQLLQFCKHTDMIILNGRTIGDIPGAFTLFNGHGCSVVDYGLASKNILSDVIYFKVESPTHLSDHCLIKLKLNVKCWHKQSTILHPVNPGYKWNELAAFTFKQTLVSENIQSDVKHIMSKNYPIDQNGADDLGQCIVTLFQKIANLSLKKKKKANQATKHSSQRKKKNVDSLHKNLKNELRYISKLLTKFPRDPYLRGRFFTCTKNLKRLIKNANVIQKNQILTKIQQLEEKNPANFWKLVNEIRQNKDNNSSIDPETLLEHFKMLHSTKPNNRFDKNFENKIRQQVNKIKNITHVDILDQPISEKEIIENTKSLKNKKSTGYDCISNEMLKASIPLLAPLFSKVYNHLLLSEKFPKPWSFGYIVALFKKGDYYDPSNYRGLTLSSCIGKLLTKILNNRLVKYLEQQHIITSNQIGFKPKQRTSDHILVLKTICDYYRSNHKAVYLCFVDLTKAFDTVNRMFLMYKLQKINLSTKFINIVQSMYMDTQACIKTENGDTDNFPIQLGTRQGCNISPNLFNIFINDLPETLTSNAAGSVFLNRLMKLNCLMYADDIVLMSETKEGLKRSLNILEAYCNKWQLIISTKKTKIIILNKRYQDSSDFILCNEIIEVVKTFTYLGIEMSHTGSFKPAVNNLFNKASRAFYSLRKTFNHHNGTHPKVIIKLFDTMITPIMTYGCEIWACYGWNKMTNQCIKTYLLNHRHCFERLLAKMCKTALGVSKYTPDLTAKAELGIYPIMGKILKNIFSYWQHLLDSHQESLVHYALKTSITMDRNNNCSYYTRIKHLLSFLDMKNTIYLVPKSRRKSLCESYRNKFNEIYREFYFAQLQPTGKTDVYYHIKKLYQYEKYLDLVDNPKLRRNITQIRTSAHCLPIELLRKKGIAKQERYCNLCNIKAIGTEMHVLAYCANPNIIQLRKTLIEKLVEYNNQLSVFKFENIVTLLLLANDKTMCFYFAIYLNKIFSLAKSQ